MSMFQNPRDRNYALSRTAHEASLHRGDPEYDIEDEGEEEDEKDGKIRDEKA